MKACNGVCQRYRPVGRAPAGGRYRNGQKRCQVCEVYMLWEGLHCPCCGVRLRSKPRSSKYKEKFRVAKALELVVIKND